MELCFLGLPLSFLAAAIPTVFWVLLIGWFDRYEKEPFLLLGVAFLWGSVGSLILSIIVEVILGLPVSLLGGSLAGILGSSMVAPVVEEGSKGLMILGFFVFAHREFDDLLDGIIYGAVIGAGFAMSENFLYFISKFAQGGLGGLAALAVMRAGVFGFSHSLYTGITGAGFGLIRYSQKWTPKVGFPILFLALGVGVHATHNLFIELTRYQSWAFLMTILSDWGWLAVLVVLAALAMRQEKRWIQKELGTEVELGTLSRAEYEVVESYRQRLAHRIRRFMDDGPGAYWRTGKFYQLATELAFKRHEMAAMGNEEGHSAEIQSLREKIAELRAML
jgi:protease PrsW